MTDATTDAATAPDPLGQVVAELDRHAATEGWDRPPRLFAIVPTADLLRREPALAAREELLEAAPDALTPVEQEGMPEAASLEDSLAQVAWPAEVVGTAVVVERIVVPPDAERDMPQDEQDALRWLAEHPRREEVRMTVAVLRDGRRASALRLRSHDEDESVLRGADLVPALADALAATLTD